MSTKRRNNTGRLFSVLPMVLGVSGYLLGAAVLILNDKGSLSEQVSYVFRNPTALVWATLVAIQLGACAALLPPLITSLRNHPFLSGPARWKMFALVIVALLLFGVLISSHRITGPGVKLPVPYQKIKVLIITSVIFLPFLGSLYGMCSIAFAMEESLDETLPIPNHVSMFLRLSRDLQWYLLVSGFIVGGATLTTGVLQIAIASLNKGIPANPSVILLYGLFGSAVIALYYIPVNSALHSAGIKLCDEILPIEDGTKEFISWSEKRTKLETFLGLNKDWLDNLRTGLILLAPLAGSAVSLLFGKAQ